MTFTEANNHIIQCLTDRYGAGEASSIARIVLEDAFHWRSQKPPSSLEAQETVRLEAMLTRLMAGEPVQYVLGEADFFGLKFKVSPAVLIPRQETEELVAWVLEFLKTHPEKRPKVLDIGAGSGCIGITLKKEYPAILLFSLEKSAEALAVATDNARQILGESNRDCHWILTDILAPDTWDTLPDFEVVISNPPYIPASEKHLVPQHVQAHEPALALFVADADPLLFYRVIAEFSQKKLLPGGELFFECNEFNAPEVAQMLAEKGFKDVRLQQDLYGADRMVAARK